MALFWTAKIGVKTDIDEKMGLLLSGRKTQNI